MRWLSVECDGRKTSLEAKGLWMNWNEIDFHLCYSYCPGVPPKKLSMSCDNTSYVNTYLKYRICHSGISIQQRQVTLKFRWKSILQLRTPQQSREHARFNIYLYNYVFSVPQHVTSLTLPQFSRPVPTCMPPRDGQTTSKLLKLSISHLSQTTKYMDFIPKQG